MKIKVFDKMTQGSEEWFKARCGVITASEMKNIITPKYKIANNAKTKTHAFEMAAQRITNYVEPSYINDDMLRGCADEVIARNLYNDNFAEVKEVGFIVNSEHGFDLGYSPDGLVGEEGLIEIKSRLQKYQIQTIANWEVPSDHDIQIHTAMLVSGRKWIDYIQYSGGLPMAVIRVEEDQEKQGIILEAVKLFNKDVENIINNFHENIKSHKTILTERTIEEEITL